MAAPPMRTEADYLLRLCALALGGAALVAAADRHFGDLKPLHHYLILAADAAAVGWLAYLVSSYFNGTE